MYRRERSGLFITLTTALIVVVMAVFTWVMWGMARQINTITETMVEVNGTFKEMVDDMHTIAGGMGSITASMVTMNQSMTAMTANMNKLTLDVGRASYAFSSPMSYMFGNGFPF